MQRRLYQKLTIVFFVVLSGLAAFQLLLYSRIVVDYVAETDQLENWGLAAKLRETLEASVLDGIDYPALQKQIFELTLLDSRVDLYLLDEQGNVRFSLLDESELRLKQIDTNPLKRFLADVKQAQLPIMAQNPRDADSPGIFSVSPILFGGKTGFLYVVLRGHEHDHILQLMWQSYVARTGVIALLLSTLLAACFGAIIFARLTKRLECLTDTVRAFERGEREKRVPLSNSLDEVAQLGNAFNRMADKLNDTIDVLHKTDQLRRELISNVSHDLRAPLGVTQGFLQALAEKRDADAPERRAKFVSLAERNLSVVTRLTEELFELSKLEAKMRQPDRKQIEIQAFLNILKERYEQLAESHQLEFLTVSGESLSTMSADVELIERAVGNLIENAIRYTPPHGRITLAFQCLNEKVRVAIADTGVGIPPEEQSLVFERAYRGSTGKSKSGSGLGLCIAKQIVEMHGSEIKLESEVGKGTCFSFDLPVA